MNDRITNASLATLIVLQMTMLFALFFKVPPHPPEFIPLGGMAPVIATSLSAAVAGMIFRGEGVTGKLLILVACIFAGLSYGPQKYADPVFAQVWPAVITAQIAIAALLLQIGKALLPRVRPH